MAKLHPSLMIILVLLALAAASCSLPARTPVTASPTILPAVTLGAPEGATVIPKDPNNTSVPTPASTPSAAASAAPLVTPTAQATAAPSLNPAYQPVDRKDPKAIIAAVRAALQQKDTRFFAQFAAESLNYIDYIEGGQPVDRARLLGDLTARFAASSPQCDQYGTYEQTLQVWTNAWNPLWQIDRICYQGCNPLNPPHTSQAAAFFFSPNANGEYEINAVWLNNDDLWRTIYRVEMHACSESYQPPPTPTVFTCPGAPATQLKLGERAYTSAQTSTPNRVRSDPGTSANILGLIQPRQVVEIVDGPRCVQGYVWWKVQLLGSTLTGWTAEGQGSSYWLEPCTIAKCGQP